MAGQDDVIDGRYRLQQRIGVGGFGEVWRVCDTRFDHPMALKLLKPRPDTGRVDEDDQRRFLREARQAKQFNGQHNIVQIHDVNLHGEQPYLVMPLLEGTTLESLLTEGRLPPPRAVAILRGIAVALAAIHEKDLVHRDVKPSNVVIGAGDSLTLLDFGIVGGTKDGQFSTITLTGQVLGTIAYMGPERLWGPKGEDPVAPSHAAGDVYSLACVLHQCLTAVAPFTGNGYQMWLKHNDTSRPRPGDEDADLREFDAVVGHGLAVRYTDRPGVADFVEEVDRALAAWTRRRGRESDEHARREREDARRRRAHLVPPVLLGGASTGLLGAGAVALVGVPSLAGGVAIAASWAAGACAGWWFGSRRA